MRLSVGLELRIEFSSPLSGKVGFPPLHKINDAGICLGNVFAVKLESVLLQRPLPRYRHRQDQRVEW